MKALLAYVRPHRRTLYVAGVLALLGAAGGLAQPLAAREVIDALASDDSLLVPLVVLGGLVVVSSVFSAAELWLLEQTSERVVLDSRRRLAARLLRMPLAESTATLPVTSLPARQPMRLFSAASPQSRLYSSLPEG